MTREERIKLIEHLTAAAEIAVKVKIDAIGFALSTTVCQALAMSLYYGDVMEEVEKE